MFHDLLCFSHLKWNFVYQRPQHLLSRYAKNNRVFFIEEPVFDAANHYYHITKSADENIWVVVFHLESNLSQEEIANRQTFLLSSLMEEMIIQKYILWYYTPLALSYTGNLNPELVVYDCMDELSAFRFAPPILQQRENELLQKADIVFTGGFSLYEIKKDKHPNVYPFPSSIDREHFAAARDIQSDPHDQLPIPNPRFGFYGVVDERINLELLDELAAKKPGWHFVIIGPVAKIDPEALPKSSNIHYLGNKSYYDLPKYLAGWDVAIMPFALNDSTKYISPTKTPEYLAGGKPVISTSIKDVVKPYGDNNYVYIADTAEEFIKSGEHALETLNKEKWLSNVDHYLNQISWNKTWNHMSLVIKKALQEKQITSKKKINEYV